MVLTLRRREIFQQLVLVTARCFNDAGFQFSTFYSVYLFSLSAVRMAAVRKFEAGKIAPKCERSVKIRNGDACVISGKSAKWHGLVPSNCSGRRAACEIPMLQPIRLPQQKAFLIRSSQSP